MIEEELNRHNIPIVFIRVLAEGIFVTNAFTFYNGVSPCQAHTLGDSPFSCLTSTLLTSPRGPRRQATNANVA
eukprot:3680616-Pyramimonas_sp.AAC.1